MKVQIYNTVLKNSYFKFRQNVSIVNTLQPFGAFGNCRFYSSSSLDPDSESSLNIQPIPIFTLNNLNDKNLIKSYQKILKNKGGVYSFINTINDKKYIGSAKDFYKRLFEHLENKKSNIALQKAFEKYGLDKFNFCIYEYFTYQSKVVNNKALTDLETSYIKNFNFDTLYNFKSTATSLLGYKHTNEAKLKMKKFYENKNNHPMFGKNHSEEALVLISKPGKLNPMYGKKHNDFTKVIMALKKNKHPLGIGIYDLNDNLISKFKNNVELAKHLNISKVTVGRYLKSGLVYNKIYRFKVILCTY